MCIFRYQLAYFIKLQLGINPTLASWRAGTIYKRPAVWLLSFELFWMHGYDLIPLGFWQTSDEEATQHSEHKNNVIPLSVFILIQVSSYCVASSCHPDTNFQPACSVTTNLPVINNQHWHPLQKCKIDVINRQYKAGDYNSLYFVLDNIY